MSDAVRESYDANAALYASLFLDGLDGDRQSRTWLATFADMAREQVGPVADLGCGPGNVVAHLCDLGLRTVGLDLSPGQIAQARAAFPELSFGVGDLADLPDDDGSFGGIVARYSLIHVPPSDLSDVFGEWLRVLEPGAPALLAFFGSKRAAEHGRPFDHTVATAYELWPATIARQLEHAGFCDLRTGATPIPDGGRPFDHAFVLARKPASLIGPAEHTRS